MRANPARNSAAEASAAGKAIGSAKAGGVFDENMIFIHSEKLFSTAAGRKFIFGAMLWKSDAEYWITRQCDSVRLPP